MIAHANFKGQDVTLELIKEALRDLFALQEKLVTIDNIQRSVAEYYKIKMADMLSKRRNRSVARPRQVAMTLSKELTNHSLPEIGDAFGGRDHTTVLHACRQIAKLRHSSRDIQEDYNNLCDHCLVSKKIIEGNKPMQFSVGRESLLKPLQMISGVVERRQTLPILSNVLVTLDNSELSLTGTDLEVELAGK